MSGRLRRGATRVALGLRAVRGGAAAVVLRLDAQAPVGVYSGFLATAEAGDRLAYEPYHVAAESFRASSQTPLSELAAMVDEGRRRQVLAARQGLDGILGRIRPEDGELRSIALLVNRASWVPDLLGYSLAYADHPPVAEGLAVRESLKAALSEVGLPVTEMDEKSLGDRAVDDLGLSSQDLSRVIQELGKVFGAPWRKEQKAACLAAWVVLGADKSASRKRSSGD